MINRLNKLFSNSKSIVIDDSSKIVIMSDCHRGSGDNYDNFSKNERVYIAALRKYYIDGFTYIELGDGDEMWEVKDYSDIVREHIDSFKMIKRFYDLDRFIMIYGNHDIDKRKKEAFLFGKVYESLVLKYKDKDIFMLHGHQVDILNGYMWFISKFLVRYIWKHFEHYLINDPTSAIKNYSVSKSVEKRLDNWSNKNNKIIIAGHTHRPVFPVNKSSKYFNDGACIHPNGIACIEIEKGRITLVKWSLNNSSKYSIPKRKVLAGGNLINEFYK